MRLLAVGTVLTFTMLFTASATPPIAYPVGEQITYRIVWGFIPVGQAVISCEETMDQEQPAIRIRVEARSNRMVSTLYPVNDRIDSYIDTKSGLPFRVEKNTLEGDHVCNDTLWLDHDKGIAHWESQSASITTNYVISSDTLDVAAFLHALRSTPFQMDVPQHFQIAVDGLLHGLTITAEESRLMKTTLFDEKILCTRFSVIPDREDLFVRKIPSDVWVTADDRRIMVQMKAKTPVGHARIVLEKISSPN